jgi:DNA gyrase subunit A
VPAKGRDTMGVVFARMSGDDRILAVARNSERGIVEEDGAETETSAPETPTAAQTPAAETPEA